MRFDEFTLKILKMLDESGRKTVMNALYERALGQDVDPETLATYSMDRDRIMAYVAIVEHEVSKMQALGCVSDKPFVLRNDV